MWLVTKGRFSPYFGQKLAFFAKPTHVLQAITKEWLEVQTSGFFLMIKECLKFLLLCFLLTWA